MLSISLTSRYSIISDQITQPALEVVLGQLEKVLASGVEGAIVEFGCYIGTTSLFIRRLLDEVARKHRGANQSDTHQFHVYDSFEGLPAKRPQDMSPVGADFKRGELSVSKKQLLLQFQRARLRAPFVHKGWFNQLTDREVPEKIAFAFLDGDFYDSIRDSLQLVWPRLQPGGIICIDDYQRETLPGVEQAVHDFFQGQLPAVKVSHNIGTLLEARSAKNKL